MAPLSHPAYDRLLYGSPLRRRGACLAIGAVLLAILAVATLHPARPPGRHAARTWRRSSTPRSPHRAALAVVPIAILWFLDRRERETPWLFAAAFLWGAVHRHRARAAVQHRVLPAGRRVGRAEPDDRGGARPRRGDDDRRRRSPRRSSRSSPRRSACSCSSGCCAPSSTTCATASSTARWSASASPGSRRRCTSPRATPSTASRPGAAARLALRAVRVRRARDVHRHLRRVPRARDADAAPVAEGARADLRARRSRSPRTCVNNALPLFFALAGAAARRAAAGGAGRGARSRVCRGVR